MIHPESFSQQEQSGNLNRRRKKLATKFKNTIDLFERCRIAQNFEELCEEAFPHGRATHPSAENYKPFAVE